MTVTVATLEDLTAALDAALDRRTGTRRLAWTVPEVATSLGTSPDSVRRLIRAGHLPLVPHMGNRKLVPVAALEQFVSPGSTGDEAGFSASVSPLLRPQAVDRGAVSTAGGGDTPPAA